MTGQRELSAWADGNGIQIDHFCDGNTVGFNVVWANMGAGINLYVGKGNTIHSNTLFHNNQRSTWPLGTEFGELTLSGGFTCPSLGQVTCSSSTGAQACVVGRPYICGSDGLEATRGRTSNNVIRDNLLVADPALAPVMMPGLRVTSTFVSSQSGNTGNKVWTNAYAVEQGQPDPGMPKLLWVDTVYNDLTAINQVTGASTAAQESTLGQVAFKSRAAPQANGLRLAQKPDFSSKGYSFGLPDMCNNAAVTGQYRYGAYYFPNAASCARGFPVASAALSR